MTEDVFAAHIDVVREQLEGYKDILVIVGGFHLADDASFVVIERGSRPAVLPSDFLGDPFFFDTSGSLPDEMIRTMAAEVNTIMGDISPMEISPRGIEDRMMALLDSPFARETRELRLEYDAVEVRKMRMADFPFLERKPSHGAPRSIKETRRAQGRGNKANAMRGWKRK